MKNHVIALLSLLLALALLSGCGTTVTTEEAATSDIIVSLAADQGGINDKALNEGAYNGLLQGQETYGYDLKVIESRSADDYEPTLDTFVAAGSDLIVGIGSQMPTAIALVAERNPDLDFISVDAVAEGDNVRSYVFKEQECGFLAGLVAGTTTKTNKVGFIGGKDVAPINRFEVGFAAGVMAVNPEAAQGLYGTADSAGTAVKFVDSWSDSNKSYEIAKSLYNDGCDVVFHAAGGAGVGLFQVAKDLRDSGLDIWAIGVDQDQAVVLPEYADYILTSAMKCTDQVVYGAVVDKMEGNFSGGTVSVGLADNALALAESEHISDETQAMIDKATEMVKDGTLVIPDTRAGLLEFTGVDLS